MDDLAKEQVAEKMIEEFKQLKTKADAIERKLDDMGFDVDSSGNFPLNYKAPDSRRERVDDELERKIGSKDEVLTQAFVSARIKLWAVATVEEAERTIEPLLNFEVKVK